MFGQLPPSELLELHLHEHSLLSHLQVLSLEGRERINGLYSFDIRVSADPRDDLPNRANLLLSRVEAILLPHNPRRRHLYGIVRALTVAATTREGRQILHIELAPKATLLELKKTSRVFQDQSAIEVVTTILSHHGIPHSTRLSREYPKRAQCVQYNETDLAFVQRILAEVGVFFYFDHPPHGVDGTGALQGLSREPHSFRRRATLSRDLRAERGSLSRGRTRAFGAGGGVRPIR